jgi:hypothetical protein
MLIISQTVFRGINHESSNNRKKVRTRAVPDIFRANMKTLTLEVDAELAKEYHDAYAERFEIREFRRATLKNFLRGFIEDRLREEIEFLNAEFLRS